MLLACGGPRVRFLVLRIAALPNQVKNALKNVVLRGCGGLEVTYGHENEAGQSF